MKLKYVYLANGRWVYRPYIPASKRAGISTDKGGFTKPIRLGKKGDPESQIVEAHAAAFKQLHGEQVAELTLYWLVDQYVASLEYDALASSTQKKTKTLRKFFDHELTANDTKIKLGELFPHEVTKPTVRKIRDKRLKQYQANGRSGLSHCNREVTFASTVMKWASEHYDEITDNPFIGIKRLVENISTRYVSDAEYDVQFKEGAEVADYLPVVMELTYLTATRGCESLAIKIKDIMPDGNGIQSIRVERTKGSSDNFIQITPRLQAAIDAAMALHRQRKVSGVYLVPGMNGAVLRKSTVDDAFQRLKKRMHAKGQTCYWTLHDLKRKGVSDAKSNRIAGHKSEAMRERYKTNLESHEAPR